MGSPRHLVMHLLNCSRLSTTTVPCSTKPPRSPTYVDQAFDGPPLQPKTARAGVDEPMDERVEQSLLSLHRRSSQTSAFDLSGSWYAPDEKVVAAALPKIALGLDVMEMTLIPVENSVHDRSTLADFSMLPTMTSLSLTPEGHQMLEQQTMHRRLSGSHGGATERRCSARDGEPHVGKPSNTPANGWSIIGHDISSGSVA